MVYQGLSVTPGTLVTVGLDYKSYGGAADNTKLPAPPRATLFSTGKDFSVNELAGYVTVQHSLTGQIVLNGGLRADRHSLFGTELVPQAGASYSLDAATTLRATVSKGYRSPAIRELYLFPPKNPHLKPERMWNYEVGASHTFLDSRVTVEGTAFLAEGDNLIKATGVPPNVKNMNTGAFTHRGLEFEGTARVTSTLDGRALYSYLCVNAPVLAVPEHDLFVEGRMTVGPATISANFRVVSGLTTVVTPLRTTSYALLGLEATVDLTPSIAVFANLDNLLDARYEINAHYPMPGRTVLGGVSVKM